jgi:VanZ family protein
MKRLIIILRPFSRYLLILWLIIIITLSSLPNIPTLKIHTAKADIRIDYFIHFLEYGALTLLCFLAFTGENFRMDFLKALKLMIMLILFALLDEYHQKFIPGRSFNYSDILSNLTGIVAGIVFCGLIFRMIRIEISSLHNQ